MNNKELFRQIKHARSALSLTVIVGVLGAIAVIAQQAAIRIKSELWERLFAHLLQLGPAYSRSERTGELVATANEGSQ